MLALIAAPAWALDPALVAQLGAEDSDARVEAIRKLVATEDPRVIDILKALDGEALALIDQRRARRHRYRRPADRRRHRPGRGCRPGES